MVKPKYKFYATLLDSYQHYLKSDREEAFQEFINKVNRVPFTSEAANRGIAFNELLDSLLQMAGSADCRKRRELEVYLDLPGEAGIRHGGFEFRKSIVEYFRERLTGSVCQVFVKATLPTRYGDVELYGYIDNLLAGSALDVKTCNRYDFPKFNRNWQHIVYPYCLIQQGISEEVSGQFTYEVTDFKDTYREEYIYQAERDLPRLQSHCESLIEFLEQHRSRITDRKVFALD